MNTAKVYYDSDGTECSIWQMVHRNPVWAAVRIQEGEKAIELLDSVKARLDGYDAVKCIEMLPEIVDFVASIENDDGRFPAFMWEWRNKILSTIKAGGEE